jgi:O-antigen biosynthesis protein
MSSVQLSVIIVNYNVKHFLEQCLASVQRAAQQLPVEVLVVDNASADGSLAYLQPLFPQVTFIANKENTGFAKANNQAVALAKGRYILFLNPDTLVPEDAFTKSIAFFEQHPQCGALGLRMVDGSGQFLRESKRAFPSPVTSFYKLSGLARLFPKSATFSKYHLGHLSEHETHEVDVLAGAYMMIAKTILDEHGSFDEAFFMYGEDVDLSYRIQKAGYKNYYYPGVTIIHFKGESTRRGSLNYVKMFYNAMSLFVKKHYGQARAGTFNLFIQTAIWLRAAVSGVGRFIKKIGLPLLDAALVLLCIWAVKLFWFQYIKPDVKYVREVLIVAASSYTLIYIISGFFTGMYDNPYKQGNLNRSALTTSVLLLALYGLLPEQYRFSRGIIFVSAILVYLTISLFRWLLLRWNVLESAKEVNEEKQTVVVGTAAEYQRAEALYAASALQEKLLGRIDPGDNTVEAIGTLAGLHQLESAVSFKEIVFCEGKLSFTEIIKNVQQTPERFKIKFFASGTHSIVGSDSKDTTGDAISLQEKFMLSHAQARRCKRMADVVCSLILLFLSPLLFWFSKQKTTYFANALQVLLAGKTWVGYAQEHPQWPPLRPGVLESNGKTTAANRQLSPLILYQLDYRYAKNYRCYNDIKLIMKGF